MFNPNKRLLDDVLDLSSIIKVQLTATLVSRITKIPRLVIYDKLRRLSVRLEKVKPSEMKTIASYLKAWESYVMAPDLFGRPQHSCPFHRIIFGGLKMYSRDRSRELTLLLLGVHKGLKNSFMPNTKTITRKVNKKKVRNFIARHREILTNEKFVDFLRPKVYPRIFTKYTSVSKLGRQYSRTAFNPYSMDPSVDSNNRTSGRTFPIRVTFKGCSNGKACSSQMLDLIAIKRRPGLHRAIDHLNVEASGNPLPMFLLDGSYDPASHDVDKTKLFSSTSKGGESTTYFGFPKGWKLDADEYLRRIKRKPIVSKLHVIESPSAKARVIAILDSLSQCALKHLHNILETSVRKIPTDFTFDQPASFNYLNGLSVANGEKFHSVDISAATDTIPFLYSRFILDQIITPDVVSDPAKYVSSVSKVLTRRPFTFNGKDYWYGTGQPMGSYGSFNLLALTQHSLVQLAHWLVTSQTRVRPFRHYAVVGDDVVIRNNSVASKYLELLSDLDIPVNKAKSLCSIDSFEFCKRIFTCGKAQNTLSLKGIATAAYMEDPALFYALYVDREFPFTYSDMCMHFSKTKVSIWMRLTGIKLAGQPKRFTVVPQEVSNHAARVSDISRSFKKPSSLITLDNARPEDRFLGLCGTWILSPWVSRLNYSAKIAEVFSSYRTRSFNIDTLGVVLDKVKAKIRKKNPSLYPLPCPWLVAMAAGANSFYLSYLPTYFDKRERKPHILRKDSAGARAKLYRLCMLNRNFWDSTDKLRSYVIDPENIRSRKLRS